MYWRLTTISYMSLLSMACVSESVRRTKSLMRYFTNSRVSRIQHRRDQKHACSLPIRGSLHEVDGLRRAAVFAFAAASGRTGTGCTFRSTTSSRRCWSCQPYSRARTHPGGCGAGRLGDRRARSAANFHATSSVDDVGGGLRLTPTR